ncbi:MAG: MopE-related protein [Myxococcota bacterium]
MERGVVDAPFTLTIAASDGGTLLYGLGAGDPTTAYTGPLAIDGTTIVRAREVAGDGTAGEIVTHTYLFVADVMADATMDAAYVAQHAAEIEASLRTLPTISVIAPVFALDTEVAGSFEWIDPAGEVAQANCGVKIVGGTSWQYPKASLRLTFRDDYGPPKLALDLYGEGATGVAPADEHDALTLRSGNHDTVFYLGSQGQHLRNLWMDESQLEMGHVAPHGRFAHLYENGAYWGVYHVRERFNAAMLAEYLGGDEDDYEAINAGSAFDGDGGAWAALVASSGTFAEARRWLDVENFLDYMVLNFYAANAWDWYTWHNWQAAGPDEPDEGGFRFHSSDSDICLYYDYTTDITSLTGPDGVFGALVAEGDPDFAIALADAIARNLDGPLSAEATAARYERIAATVEGALYVESARWGYGWWDVEGEWAGERDRLLTQFFPYRTEVLRDQARARGWYPLDPPTFDVAAGLVPAGTTLTVSGAGELVVSLDGEDPREPGGAVHDGAELADGTWSTRLDRSTIVKARTRSGDAWGPLAEGFWEVDEAPAIVLNEWNAVDPDATLAEGDDALGTLAGNGGDWIELVVIEDHLDVRGWRLVMEDRAGERGEIALADVPLLADLRAGTILTVAEDLPEDPAYAPDAGDWRFHLRATPDGAHASSDGFDVTHLDWRLTVLDAGGRVRFGPAGETVAPRDGLSKSEVGQLAGDPGEGVRRDDGGYSDAKRSSYGAPNVWADGEQDFSALRGETGGVVDRLEDTGDPPAAEPAPDARSCGCESSGGGGLALVLLAMLLLTGCKGETTLTPDPPATVPDTGCDDLDLDGAGCDDCDDDDPAVHPGAPEVCDGDDDDCDGLVDDADDDVADPLPFWADRDGDGYGDDDTVVLACSLGAGVAIVGGDCDDGDAAVHPDAQEACDEVDQDCDGLAGDSIGASEECPATSCLAIAEAGGEGDGAYWITLPDGSTAELWCDLGNGGWTLGFVRNTAHTGSQGGFGGAVTTPEDLAVSPEEASLSSTPRMGWLDLNAYEWTDLRLAAYQNGARTYLSRDVSKSALRIAFGQDGYLLYGGDTGYYWCGGDASYTDGGVGAVDNPAGAPADCKGHGSLGSGWDFSESDGANAGLTLCGGDGSYFLSATWGGAWTWYGAAGAAQAIWVR